jgi:hypothetical protein
MLTRLDGFEHELFGNAVATNQFNHDVDLRIGDDFTRIVYHLNVCTHNAFGTYHIEVGHHSDFNATTCAACDFFLVALEHFKSAAANSADA